MLLSCVLERCKGTPHLISEDGLVTVCHAPKLLDPSSLVPLYLFAEEAEAHVFPSALQSGLRISRWEQGSLNRAVRSTQLLLLLSASSSVRLHLLSGSFTHQCHLYTYRPEGRKVEAQRHCVNWAWPRSIDTHRLGLTPDWAAPRSKEERGVRRQGKSQS